MKAFLDLGLQHTWWAVLVFAIGHNVYAADEIVIDEGRTVSIHYELRLDDGSVVSSNTGDSPLVYTQGDGKILPALETALKGMKNGDVKKVSLSAEEGYGPVQPEAFVEMPLERIPEDARQIGTTLVGRDASGNERYVRVHEIKGDHVVIDHNHPLAGENLHFTITVISIE